MSILSRLPAALQPLVREISKFGAVGLVGTIVDFGAFNVLRYLGEDGQGILFDQPLLAKALSVIVATIVTFTGNLLWTYRNQAQRRNVVSGYLLFFFFNAIGMAFALGCLWISHYGLGLTNPLADNISANVIGLGLGTIFRFWAYRKWVFRAA